MFKMSPVPALLVLAAAFANLLPAPANAQKPALIKNVDERGRVPYQQTVLFAQSDTTCASTFFCTVSFNPVPAGFRLVVTHASAMYKLGNGTAGGGRALVSLIADGNIFGNSLLLPVPTPLTGVVGEYVVSSPVTYYIEPGSTPGLLLQGSPVANDGHYGAQVTIVGYLVAIP